MIKSRKILSGFINLSMVNMETRNQIHRTEKVKIHPNNYNEITTANFLEVLREIVDEHPTARFEGIHEIDEDQRGFGSMEMEPVMGTSYYLYYSYFSPETDEEFEARMIYQEKRKKEIEEQEKLEYLRLKAKFENG